MNAGYILAGQTVSGRSGTVYVNMGGRVRPAMEIKSLTAKITKKKDSFDSLGQPATQYKSSGWEGSGTVTYYWVTTEWIKQAIDYARTGKDVYYTMTITNEDPTSVAVTGTQEITLLECNSDEMEVAKLDIDATHLDGTFNFTFSGIDLGKEFNPIYGTAFQSGGPSGLVKAPSLKNLVAEQE